FFSSRRRHTRSKRDWSSDVCSSDLPQPTRHPNRGSLTVKLAAEEVNNVPILFDNHGISRRRGGFYGRSGSVGCESFSQEERIRRSEERRVGKEWRSRW